MSVVGAVLLRDPVPGHVKTRLHPALGVQRATRLYGAFIQDTLACVAGVAGLSPRLWVAGDPASPRLALPCLEGLQRQAQPELDLGGRIAAALHAGLGGAGACIALGSDAPSLPSTYLSAAVQALGLPASGGGADMVLGPAADGGYYLVGLGQQARGSLDGLFRGVRWSSRHTLADTALGARRAGLSVRMLCPWYDVDDGEDLRLLRLQLAAQPALAPASARVLAGF